MNSNHIDRGRHKLIIRMSIIVLCFPAMLQSQRRSGAALRPNLRWTGMGRVGWSCCEGQATILNDVGPFVVWLDTLNLSNTE